MLSQVSMIFWLAPAIAPVFGGWLQNWFPWQSVFVFMAIFSGLQLVASYFSLPETLLPEQRSSMKLPAVFVAHKLSFMANYHCCSFSGQW
jgi:DHA1 family bicyclomycin/chloramphenicol resistance-like MFS transporter